MFSSTAAGKSVDSLGSLASAGRADHPLHSSRSAQAHPRPSSRRGSTASSIHSIGGALDTSSSTWSNSVFESGHNAISTLLQPPIVRTGLQPYTSATVSNSHKPPTARDIPPVTLTNIPHVEVEEFSPYITQVGALYEQLRRAKESNEEEVPSRKGSKQDEQAETGGEGYLRPATKHRVVRKGSTASLSSINSIEAPSPVRRSSSSFARKATAQGPPPLSTIPTVYFDEDFHLENPRTFDVVSERSEVVQQQPESKGKGETNGTASAAASSAAAPRKALATNAILQEKLSWYMDTVEVHLINSISTASSTFFTALGSLKELHSEASDSVDRIRALRTELEALDEEVATHGLQIVQKRRRRENLQQLSNAVWQLKRVVDAVASCEALVDTGELEKALSGIDSLEKLITGEFEDGTNEESARLRDLSGASALQGVNNDIAALRFRIGKAFDNQFSTVLMTDLRGHAESVPMADVLQRWSNAASRARGGHSRSPSLFPTYLSSTSELKGFLAPPMVGLNRAKHVATAAMVYREAVLREIRNIIRRPLPSSNDDDNESMMSASTASGGRGLSNHEKSTNLARNLRALDAEDAEELLTKIYVGVTETLRRLSTQVKVLLDIASSLTDSPDGDGMKSPPVRSPISSPRPDRFGGHQMGSGFELQEELHKALDINNLLGQAVDLANAKVVKLLKVRSEQATRLSLDMFLRYFTLNLYFANECEAISGRSGTSLKTVVNGHIKDFVEKSRDSEMQKLAQSMESDQWSAADFTEADSQLLEQILESSTRDPAAWSESNRIWIPPQDLERLAQESAELETNGNSKEKSRFATIESEKFVLPKSAVLCLQGMTNFLHLIAGIPSMTSDVALSLVTYLQLFNSRCTQLILGAGATKSAGLKNITTKHLALASQALSFIATLIPHIREFVRRHASSGTSVSSLMGEFDKVRRLLQEHQDSIHQKLVEIMSGRAALHSKSMKAIAWDTDTSTVPHPYMEILAKETTTLHRVLNKHLPEISIQMIMLPVFASYKEQLGDALREASVKTQAGQDSILRDLELFSTKLGKLEGFGDTGEFLTKIAKSKEVKSPEPKPAAEETKETTEDEELRKDKDAASEAKEGQGKTEGPVEAEAKNGEAS